MIKQVLFAGGIAVLAVSTLLADFSYQETTTITGGAMVGMLKFAGVFSKSARQAREPIQSTIAVKGDRMVHRSPTSIQIIDLGNQTITSIDIQKKSYTVMTFEQMKQMLDEMSKKMSESKNNGGNQNQAAVSFKVSADNTGKSKPVSGLDAKEMVITMTMEGTDKQTGQSGSMVVIADEWIAPKVPGFDEVRDFQRRMAEKLAWTPGSNMFAARPEMAQGMAEVAKETARLNGMPVFTTVSMGPEGMQPVDRSDKTAQPAQESKGPSAKSVIGGALGGRFGLGRKKEPAPEPQQQPAEAGGTAPGVLIEMTTEMTNFSSNAVDPSQFEIPAGFKKVEFDPKRGMQ
jgi:hypothetical protein